MAISNFIGIIGIITLLAIAFLFSNNKKKIKWNYVLFGLGFNIILCFLIIRTSAGEKFFIFIGNCVTKLLGFANNGIAFVFGPLYTSSFSEVARTLPPEKISSQLGITSVSSAVHFSGAFIFTALIPIIFFGSIMALLYHFGVMQRLVKFIAYSFSKMFGLKSAESVGLAANVFIGQSQAPLSIAPYLKTLTSSELFLTMVGGMATVSGTLLYAYQSMGAYLPYVIAASVLAAPGSVIMAKIIFPETSTAPDEGIEMPKAETKSSLEAISSGAADGGKVAIGIGMSLISFLAVIAFLDWSISYFTGGHFHLNDIIAYIFYPISYLLGVPADQVFKFSTLLGQKTVFNEFVAYSNLSNMFPEIITSTGINLSNIPVTELKAYMMSCFALTGFANFSSIAIQIGGIGSIVPSRKSEIAALGLKALLAAVLANLLNAALVGIFIF